MTRSETIKTFFLKSVLPFGLHRMCLWIVPSNSLVLLYTTLRLKNQERKAAG